MDQTKTEAAQFDVCPRCNGKGEIKCFAHVKAGVCFNCWGMGWDVGGAVRHAAAQLSRARSEWVRMQLRLRRTAPGSLQREACEQGLESIKARGLSLKKAYDHLVAQQQALASRFKNLP